MRTGYTALLTLGLSLLPGCSPPGPSLEQGCEGMCEPYTLVLPEVGACVEGQCTPTFHECFDKAEFDTCEAYCQSIGSVCAQNACGGGTYVIHAIVEWCEDPSKEGVVREGSCEEPIGWQVNTGARCCCEQ